MSSEKTSEKKPEATATLYAPALKSPSEKTTSDPAPVLKATKKARAFADVLKEVDPKSLSDELEALQAAYDGLSATRERIRVTVGKAHAGVQQAINHLKSVAPLLKKLSDEEAKTSK